MHSDAKYCCKCNRWQSLFRQSLSSGIALSFLLAIVGLLTVYIQYNPLKAPTLIAMQSVIAFEEHAKYGCEKTQTNECFDDYWDLQLTALDDVNNVANFAVHKELKIRINNVMDKYDEDYMNIPKWYIFPDL